MVVDLEVVCHMAVMRPGRVLVQRGAVVQARLILMGALRLASRFERGASHSDSRLFSHCAESFDVDFVHGWLTCRGPVAQVRCVIYYGGSRSISSRRDGN